MPNMFISHNKAIYALFANLTRPGRINANIFVTARARKLNLGIYILCNNESML